MAAPTREDTYVVRASIDNNDIGVWDTFSGGEIDSEESKYRPGGMDTEISLGGRRTIGNVTISRYYDYLRDHGLYLWLCGAVGKSAGAIAWFPMSRYGQIVGGPIIYTGTVKRVEHADIDSMGSDASMIELEFTIDAIG